MINLSPFMEPRSTTSGNLFQYLINLRVKINNNFKKKKKEKVAYYLLTLNTHFTLFYTPILGKQNCLHSFKAVIFSYGIYSCTEISDAYSAACAMLITITP